MNHDTLLLSTCFDTIEDSNSDDQARAWIRKALDAKIDLARFVADRRGKGRATEVPGHISSVFLEEKLVNEEIMLNPDLDNVVLDKFYRQVAEYLLQLSRLEFKRIGAISKEPGDGGWSSSKRPLTYNMNELATSAGYPTDDFPTTSFANASDFFKHVAHEHLTHLDTQRNLAATPEVAGARYIARHRYL
ncbi:hypothetical protein N0V84_011733 [Fusarium piperis]|uniref:Uncharacterized protein n=1 Tax=Fusarium piperis TaxID=1435070 RepID=A0A9W8TBK8_9HYPO|nr:hypothetical protein N0V84_011733 [Fusarium piperis]